jgi:hypothetical protein
MFLFNISFRSLKTSRLEIIAELVETRVKNKNKIYIFLQIIM